jgi:hypothetical protein
MLRHNPWLRPADKLLATLCLLVACGLAVSCGGGPQYPRPAAFAAYPPDPSLDEIVQMHIEAGTDRDERLVLTTWFQDGDPQVAQVCSIRPDGRRTTYQYVHKVSLNASKSIQLTPETLQTVMQALTTLPPSTTPPLANLLIVSFRQGGQWQTRLYDRTSRPPGASTVFELTNAPIVP